MRSDALVSQAEIVQDDGRLVRVEGAAVQADVVEPVFFRRGFMKGAVQKVSGVGVAALRC